MKGKKSSKKFGRKKEEEKMINFQKECPIFKKVHHFQKMPHFPKNGPFPKITLFSLGLNLSGPDVLA